MKIVKPIVRPKNNVLTTQPFTPDSTLVDDTVRLVDDTTALSGSNIAIIPSIRGRVKTPRVYTRVRLRR